MAIFGGQQITRPGAYSVVDSSGMFPVEIGGFRVLAFVGTADKAVSEVDKTQVLYFNSPKEAAAALVEGELLANMQVAWGHGADLIAVSIVESAGATAPTDAQWQTALDRLEIEFVDGIIPVTTAAAVHTKVDQHIQSMSSIRNRKERRGFYGHAAGLKASDVAALTATLKTERAVFATPAVKVAGASGKLTVKDSVRLASAYAGLWALKEPQDPITYDYVKFAGLETIYKADEIDALLTAGVAVTEFIKGKGYRIVQGVTTAASEDITQVELSVSTLKDVMSKTMREVLEDKHVGTAGVAGVEVTVYNDAITILEGFKQAGYITGYVAESVQVRRTGTAFTVDWEGKPTLPINNFFITSHFTL